MSFELPYAEQHTLDALKRLMSSQNQTHNGKHCITQRSMIQLHYAANGDISLESHKNRIESTRRLLEYSLEDEMDKYKGYIIEVKRTAEPRIGDKAASLYGLTKTIQSHNQTHSTFAHCVPRIHAM
ncbi:hypothetical protein BDF14DRAFT_1885210 [Spinellus fusiger]|nr:hypothetical protein BDF14DRAFT_1885210 [Spinellus fusiger]